MKYLTLITSLFLVLGCFPLLIGYYTFLRIVVFVVCIVVIVKERERGLDSTNIIAGMIAIVFNPIIPIYLHDKTWWIVIDLLTAIVFGFQTYRYYNESLNR